MKELNDKTLFLTDFPEPGKESKKTRSITLISPKKGYVGLLAQKIGRNDPCPCGSGKKAKHCCGCDTRYLNRKEFHKPTK